MAAAVEGCKHVMEHVLTDCGMTEDAVEDALEHGGRDDQRREG